ncbi:hypothetical protein [Paraburkholderia youngii]|uniref:hypothetical protein n=1 Tax=Paraburkholderia youngii TaxID=2782701 RepID=UPI003D23D1E1
MSQSTAFRGESSPARFLECGRFSRISSHESLLLGGLTTPKPTQMLKSLFICGAAALALVSLAACSSKATPNEENFTAAVNQRMALHPMKCLPPVSWPTTADPSDAGNVMGFYDKAVALAKAGLISRRDIANYSTNNQKRAVFSLTDEGRKQLVHDNSQPPPAPGEESGRFCYGHVKLVKVVKWDEPVSRLCRVKDDATIRRLR